MAKSLDTGILNLVLLFKYITTCKYECFEGNHLSGPFKSYACLYLDTVFFFITNYGFDGHISSYLFIYCFDQYSFIQYSFIRSIFTER